MKDISKLKETIEKNLGKLNVDQLWAIVLISKHVRLRARNNSAFNNFMNNLFPYAQFREVGKVKTVNGVEIPYKGFRITIDGKESEKEQETDEE